MTTSMTLIASSTVGSGGAATITFSSIASSYTDLAIKVSARTDIGSGTTQLYLNLNGSAANFTGKYVLGTGAAAASGSLAQYAGQTETGAYTASTFSSHDIYIPNYAGSTNKSYSTDAVTENNGTTGYQDLIAGLWSQTAAINQVTLSLASGNFVQYSTAYLYGVKNA